MFDSGPCIRFFTMPILLRVIFEQLEVADLAELVIPLKLQWLKPCSSTIPIVFPGLRFLFDR